MTNYQMKELTKKFIRCNDQHEVDFEGCVLRNLKKPTRTFDASNKGYVDESVRSNNKTIMTLVEDVLKDYLKPINGVLNLATSKVKLVITESSEPTAPVTVSQLNDLKTAFNLEIQKTNSNVNKFYYPLPDSARSSTSVSGGPEPIGNIILNIRKELSMLKDAIITLKTMIPKNGEADDDDKDDFWERVSGLNK